jgi:multidrug efflux pump
MWPLWWMRQKSARMAAWANQKDAIIINVQRQPGANVIETVDKLKATLPNLKANLPESLDLEVMNDLNIEPFARVRLAMCNWSCFWPLLWWCW